MALDTVLLGQLNIEFSWLTHAKIEHAKFRRTAHSSYPTYRQVAAHFLGTSFSTRWLNSFTFRTFANTLARLRKLIARDRKREWHVQPKESWTLDQSNIPFKAFLSAGLPDVVCVDFFCGSLRCQYLPLRLGLCLFVVCVYRNGAKTS